MSRKDAMVFENINDALFTELNTAGQAQVIGGETQSPTINLTYDSTGPDIQLDAGIDVSADDA